MLTTIIIIAVVVIVVAVVLAILMKKKKGGAIMKTESPQTPAEQPKPQPNQYEQGSNSNQADNIESQM